MAKTSPYAAPSRRNNRVDPAMSVKRKVTTPSGNDRVSAVDAALVAIYTQ